MQDFWVLPPWLLGYAFPYSPIDNFEYSKGRDTIASYHSKDNETSLTDALSLLSIHHFANHAKFPPPHPKRTLMIRLLGTGKCIKGKRRSLVPFINILLEFVKNIHNHFSFFQTFLDKQMQWIEMIFYTLMYSMLTFKKIPLRKQAISQWKIGLQRKFWTFFDSPHYEVSKNVPTSKNWSFLRSVI